MRALAIVLALVTGCSFFMTRGPSDERPRRTYPSCTTSYTWPIVDGVFSVLFLTAMIGAASEEDRSSTSLDDDEASKAEKITSAAIFTALTGVSAYIGFSRVSRCKGARQEFAAGYPGGYPYPQPYPPQAYPQPQPYPQPYPGQAQPQPYPGQAQPPQPATAPQPQPQPPQPQPPRPPPPTTGPQPTSIPSVLGTEGDVCASNDECATGLACTGNVCKRPPAR